MGTYLVRRVVSMIPTLLGITVIVFVFIELAPGDAAMAILAGRVEEEEIAFTEEELAKIRREMGLDRPAPIRYLEWLGNLVRADLGVSLSTRRPVADLVSFRLGPTLELMAAAFLISSVLGLSLGVVSALKRYSPIDHALTVAGMMGISTPTFYVGLLALFLLSVQLDLFPLGGRVSPGATDTAARLHHLVLPAFILGTRPDRGAHALHALQRAGGAAPRLRHHGAQQGAARLARHPRARVPQRPDPDHRCPGAAAADPDRRLGGHRDRLQLARHGRVLHRLGARTRLSDHHGGDAVLGARRAGGQRPGGPAHRAGRPARAAAQPWRGPGGERLRRPGPGAGRGRAKAGQGRAAPAGQTPAGSGGVRGLRGAGAGRDRRARDRRTRSQRRGPASSATSRRAPPTGWAPTTWAATCSRGCCTADGCRCRSGSPGSPSR